MAPRQNTVRFTRAEPSNVLPRTVVRRTAHQLARLLYAMLTHGEEYVARDIAEWEAERGGRTIANLQRQARRSGLQLVAQTCSKVAPIPFVAQYSPANRIFLSLYADIERFHATFC